MGDLYLWRCITCKKEVESTDLSGRVKSKCDCMKPEIKLIQMELIKTPDSTKTKYDTDKKEI